MKEMLLRRGGGRLTSRRLRMALPVAGLLGFVLLSVAFTPRPDVGRPLSRYRVRTVVVFGIPRLGLGDVERMPTLDRLAREGALAATNVRTGGDTPRPEAAYATVSAGVRVDAIAGATRSLPGGAGIMVPAMDATRAAAGRYVTSEPGAVGQALREAGLETAVLSPGQDRPVGPGGSASDGGRPTGAALAVADHDGVVDRGVIDPQQLRSGAPGEGLGDLVASELARSDVVVVDPGLTMPGPAGSDDDPSPAAQLLATDRELAAVVDVLPPDALLLVVGVTPPTSEWALTPTVAWGAGVEEHRLASPTTRRTDLLALIDVGPTVLDALGVARPPGMTGQPLRQREGTVDRHRIERLDDVARGREATYFRMTVTFTAIQVLVNVGTWLLLAAGLLRPGAARLIRPLTLVCAAWPLATYLVRAVPVLMTLGSWTHVAPWPVAAAVALLASRLRRHPLAPFAAVAAATAAVIVADLATGGRLQVASILGTAPHTTYRFNGLGNAGFAVLASSALVAVGIHVDAASRRAEALVTAGCALGAVALADIAPWMGADVGGILTLLPTFGLTLLVLSGRRIRLRALVVAAALTAVGLAVAAGIDLLRPEESQTHLGRFLRGTLGDGDLGATVGRRWAANTRMFTQSPVTWIVAPFAVGMGLVVARSERIRRAVPLGPGTRVGVLAALAAGVAGWLLNDSGVVVTALVLIFAPGVLTIAALEHLAGRPGPVPEGPPAPGCQDPP